MATKTGERCLAYNCEFRIAGKKVLISIKDWQKELSIIIEFHQC